MSQFVFTPGQREEALKWVEENCPMLFKYIQTDPEMRIKGDDEVYEYKKNLLIDMYLKMKTFTFDIAPTDFIVGIEYKDKDKVIKGEEVINIRFQNPHKLGKYDELAFQVLLNLLNSLKT